MSKGKRASGIEKITKPQEIYAARRAGKRVVGKFVTLWKHDSTRGPRIGVIAGKGFRSAVERNLARRRVTGCVLDARGILDGNSEYLFECKPGSESAIYQELAKDVQNCILSC